MTNPHVAELLYPALAAIYLYACFHHCVFHIRRRAQVEHFFFGLHCLTFAAASIGTLVFMTAETTSQAVTGLRVQYASYLLGGVTFGYFVMSYTGSRNWKRAHLLGLVGAAAALLAAFGPSLEIPEGAASGPTIRQFPHSLFSTIANGLTVLGVAILSAPLLRRARRDPDLRPWTLAIFAAISLSFYDVMVGPGGTVVALLSLAIGSHLLALSYALLRRFARAANDLSARTEALDRSRRQVQRTQREMVRREELAAIGELSAVIAHEVRNPLAVLKNAVSSLRRPSLDPSDRGVLLSILDEETDRLGRLVRDLLTYARPLRASAQPFRTRPWIEEAAAMVLAEEEREGDVELSIEVEIGAERLRGDPALLGYALRNVLTNSVQAMPQGGHLEVRARTSGALAGRAVEIVVQDDGEGMDTLVLARAKHPFFTTRARGTGLGLAIVERALRSHGGSIHIESRSETGTRVRLVIPRSPLVPTPAFGLTPPVFPPSSELGSFDTGSFETGSFETDSFDDDGLRGEG